MDGKESPGEDDVVEEGGRYAAGVVEYLGRELAFECAFEGGEIGGVQGGVFGV